MNCIRVQAWLRFDWGPILWGAFRTMPRLPIPSVPLSVAGLWWFAPLPKLSRGGQSPSCNGSRSHCRCSVCVDCGRRRLSSCYRLKSTSSEDDGDDPTWTDGFHDDSSTNILHLSLLCVDCFLSLLAFIFLVSSWTINVRTANNWCSSSTSSMVSTSDIAPTLDRQSLIPPYVEDQIYCFDFWSNNYNSIIVSPDLGIHQTIERRRVKQHEKKKIVW